VAATKELGFSPCVSKPARPSDPQNATGQPRTFFVTSRTAEGRRLLQSEGMASLFIDVLRSNMRLGRFTVHDFVVMPNHIHLLVTIAGTMNLEKAVQLIKGCFSYRAGKELGFRGEIWQRGFSDVRITSEQSFREHRNYIQQNPVEAGLASCPEDYPFGSVHLKKLKTAGSKAQIFENEQLNGTTEVVP
jgi:putative transposase